jgi:hypothetical protein
MVILKNNDNVNETYSLNINGNAFECYDEGCNLNLDGLKNKAYINLKKKEEHYIEFGLDDNKTIPYVTFNGDFGNGQQQNLTQFNLMGGHLVNNEIDTIEYISNIEDDKYKFMLQLFFENTSKQKLNFLIPIIYRKKKNSFMSTLHELTLRYESDSGKVKNEVSIYDILPMKNGDNKFASESIDKSFFFKPIENNNILIVFNNPIYVDVDRFSNILNRVKETPKLFHHKNTYPWFFHKDITKDKNGDRTMIINVDNLLKLLNISDKDSFDKSIQEIKDGKKDGKTDGKKVNDDSVDKDLDDEKKVTENFVVSTTDTDTKSAISVYFSVYSVISLVLLAIFRTSLQEKMIKPVLIFMIVIYMTFQSTFYNIKCEWSSIIPTFLSNFIVACLIVFVFIATNDTKINIYLFLFVFTFLNFNHTWFDIIYDMTGEFEVVKLLRFIIHFVSVPLFCFLLFSDNDLSMYCFKILIVLYLFNNLLFMIREYENASGEDDKTYTSILFIISLILSVIVYCGIRDKDDIPLFKFATNSQGSNGQHTPAMNPSKQSVSRRKKTDDGNAATSTASAATAAASAASAASATASATASTAATTTKGPTASTKRKSSEIVSGSSFDEDKVYEKIAEIIEEMREYDINPTNNSIRDQNLRDLSRLILPLEKSAAKKIVNELGSEFKFDSSKGIIIHNSKQDSAYESIWDYLS